MPRLASQLNLCWQNLRGLSRFRPLLRERYQLKVAFVVGVSRLKSHPGPDLQARQPVVEQDRAQDPAFQARAARRGANPNASAADLGVKIGGGV